MSQGEDHKHRVCTYAEAKQAIESNKKIYLNDCFCRKPAKEGKTSYEYCGHNIETCMGFTKPKPTDEFQYEYRQISQTEALKIYENWKAQVNLFRFMEDESWICFCCECGCGFFRNEEGNKVEDTCEKGTYIEKTDLELCNLCDLCIDACVYDARSIDDEMVVDSNKCYGCSACEYVCPEDAVEMVKR